MAALQILANKPGFVKFGPEELKGQGILGQAKFEVPPSCVGIVDILIRGKHEIKTFSPGIHTLDFQLFQDKHAWLTILSTVDEETTVTEIISHPILVQGKVSDLPVNITAQVRFRLTHNLNELHQAMDNLLIRDTEHLGNMETVLRHYLRTAFQETIQRTYLRVLTFSNREVENAIKDQIDQDVRFRRELAIDVTAIQISNISFTPPPVPLPSGVDFILYRGALDLCPNVQIVPKGNRSELVLRINRDQLALLQGERGVFLPGDYPMRSENFRNPQSEIIVVSTSHLPLEMDVSDSRYFDREYKTIEITARLSLRYQISPDYQDKITFDTAGSLLGTLQSEISKRVGIYLHEDAIGNLYHSALFGARLQHQWLTEQPFEQNLGIRIINVAIKVVGLPDDYIVSDLEPLELPPVCVVKVQKLLDVTQRKLRVPQNYVAVLPRDAGNTRLLRAGDHQLSLYNLEPTQDIRLVTTEEVDIPISYQGKPLLPLLGTPIQIPISMETSVHYRFDTHDVDALEELSLNEERRQQIVQTRARSAIDSICKENWVALITKDSGTLQQKITEQLSQEYQRDQSAIEVKFYLSNYEFDSRLDEIGLTQHTQQVLLIQEAAAQHRKLLATLTEAEGRRRFEEIAPPLSAKALMQPNSEGLQQWCTSAFDALKILADRSGSGEELDKALRSLMSTFSGGQALPEPKSTPAPSPAVTPQEQTQNALEDSSKVIEQMVTQYSGSQVPSIPTPTGPLNLPNPSIERDLMACRQLIGVKAPQFQDNKVILQCRFRDGDIEYLVLILSGFDNYPHLGPVVTDCRILRMDADEEEKIPRRKVDLNSLDNWVGGVSSLIQIANEIIDRKGQIFIP